MDTDVQVNISGDATGIIDQLWQTIAPAVLRAIEFGLTEGAIAGVLLAWMVTHGTKLWIEGFRKDIPRNPAKWRFYAYGASGAWGVLLGLACWPWAGLPGFVVIALNGLWWRAVVAIPWRRLRVVLTTQTDRRLMGMES